MTQAFGPWNSTRPVGRWIAVCWLVLAVANGCLALNRSMRSEGTTNKHHLAARWVLLVALGAALLVRLVGADHEVFERAYQDEGTYYHHAAEINAGNPWRPSFVYGHVSYYAGAFALWLASLFPTGFAALATVWSGTVEAQAHQWLVLRVLVALLSAVTVLPVFGIAWWIVGGGTQDRPARALVAAACAALLYIFSPVFNHGSHLIISDYPSACLATFSLYCVVRILHTTNQRAQWRWYAAAGLFSGLAAATKYPAGTVAIAIVAAWVALTLEARRSSTAKERPSHLKTFTPLAIAGFSSLATFIAAMPTFILDPHFAIFAPRGMLFGIRQYSTGGWIGVIRENNLTFYLGVLGQALGWIALLAILVAPLALRVRERRRWLLMAFYPFAYLLLMLTMSLALERNLAPVIPVLAALAGVGVAGISEYLTSSVVKRLSARAWAPRILSSRVLSSVGPSVAIVLLAAAVPAWSTLQQTVSLARFSTRDIAARWLVDELPAGTRLFRESYTPRLPPEHFFLRRARFAARVPIEEIEQDRYQYVLLAGRAFNRFLRPADLTEDHHMVYAQRYREMFERYEEVKRFEPTRWRQGPTLILLRVVPRSNNDSG